MTLDEIKQKYVTLVPSDTFSGFYRIEIFGQKIDSLLPKKKSEKAQDYLAQKMQEVIQATEQRGYNRGWKDRDNNAIPRIG
jgi:hypothetical protein